MKDSKLITILSVLVFILLIADIFRDDIKNILNIRATSVSTTISVYVDPDTPKIFIASPLNKTYNYNTSLELNFTVIDSTLDKIYYNIDDKTNITITANITFSANATDHSSLSHKLTLFANDTAGRLNSSSVTFSINLSKGYDFDDDEFKEGESTDFDSINKTLLQNLSNVILHKLDGGKIKFIDSLNLSKDLNLSNFINISFNRIEIDSLNLIEFNKSAIIELTNLTFTNPRIKFNDIVCPSNICVKNSYSNGVLSFNVTHFTTFSTEETPSSGGGSTGGSASGGGGSSGGGARREIIEEIIREFNIDKNLIKVSLLQGETKIEIIEVENTGTTTLDITIDLVKLKDLLIFPGGVSKYELKLKPREKQLVQLIFNVPRDYKPRVYPGKIIISSQKTEKIITTIVEVESLKKIFDVDLKLSKKQVIKGDSLPLEINIFNLGKESGRVDTEIEFGIKDLEGKIIAEEQTKVAVETQTSFVDDLVIPKYLDEGRYIAYVTVIFDGETGTATEIFEVVQKKSEFLPLYMFLIYTLPGIIAIYIITRIIKYKNKESHRRKK